MRRHHAGTHAEMLALALLCIALTADATPMQHLQMHATRAVIEVHRWLRYNEATGGSSSSRRDLLESAAGVDCGAPDELQPMWFTQSGCSIASTNYTYLNGDGGVTTAQQGELIQVACDDVFCPPPRRPDCFELNGEACAASEWCWIQQHEKWGPWAMGRDGTTPDPESCSAEALQAINDANVGDAERQALLDSYAFTCDSGIAYTGNSPIPVWKPVHGQCVSYRQVQQSCIDQPLAYLDAALNPAFIRQPNGRVYDRPLVCDPAGGPGGSPLVCTGPEFEVLPSTCVQARPQDVCFSGPWWYSLDCPRTADGAPTSGLNRDQLMNIAATDFLLYAGEVGWPATCAFWDTSTRLGMATEAARRQVYHILGSLWPADERIVGPAPTYDEIFALLPVGPILANITACYENEDEPESDEAAALAQLGHMATQPNKVWSGVHFLMHNQPNPMTRQRVEAARAVASFLLEHFWCDDCRGFFYEGIVVAYGMPPESTDPEKHARWWWWAHNVASEHVASVRGGHPWMHQLGEPSVAAFQNPFFMSWETAVAQWTAVVPPV